MYDYFIKLRGGRMKLNLQTGFAVCAITLLIIAGCSSEDAGTGSAGTGSPTAEDLRAIYQAAIADSRRPAEDVARDAGRKPAQILEFFGIAPGQRVLDISSGNGYFTRIISGVVGNNGSVVANNSGSRINDEFKANLQTQYSSYDNVELNYETPEAISLPDNSVDTVLLALVVHHWHYADEWGGFVPAVALQRYDNIFRMLKPGGTFAVIDHEAQPGMARKDSSEIHRITAENAIDDITLAGFVLDPETDISLIHANEPNDDITIRWASEPRDATRRIVHRYRKPMN
jgi:predicted methyltransferase